MVLSQQRLEWQCVRIRLFRVYLYRKIENRNNNNTASHQRRSKSEKEEKKTITQTKNISHTQLHLQGAQLKRSAKGSFFDGAGAAGFAAGSAGRCGACWPGAGAMKFIDC